MATWAFFAYCATSLFVAALCMAVHLRQVRIAPRHLFLLSLGALCAGVGCVIAGMQAGPAPTVAPAQALPIVRVLWSVAATCLLVECLLYMFSGRGGPRPH